MSAIKRVHNTNTTTLPFCRTEILFIQLADAIYTLAYMLDAYRESRHAARELSMNGKLIAIPTHNDDIDDESDPIDNALPVATDMTDVLISVTIISRTVNAIKQLDYESNQFVTAINHHIQRQQERRIQLQIHEQQRRRIEQLTLRLANERAELINQQRLYRERKAILTRRSQVISARIPPLLTCISRVEADAIIQHKREAIHADMLELIESRRRRLLYILTKLYPIIPLQSRNQRRDRERRLRVLASGGNEIEAITTITPSITDSIINVARLFTIASAMLPPFDALSLYDDDSVATALGHCAFCVQWISRVWACPLRYRIIYRMSRSIILDEVEPINDGSYQSSQYYSNGTTGGGISGGTSQYNAVTATLNQSHAYPLWSRGVSDISRFEYAVYFLNLNIEQLLNANVVGWMKAIKLKDQQTQQQQQQYQQQQQQQQQHSSAATNTNPRQPRRTRHRPLVDNNATSTTTTAKVDNTTIGDKSNIGGVGNSNESWSRGRSQNVLENLRLLMDGLLLLLPAVNAHKEVIK